MTHRHLRMLACLVIFVLLAGGCRSGEGLFATSPTAVPIPAVRSEARLVAEGRVLPAQYARLASSTGGEVVEIVTSAGAAVTPGQLLLRIDDAQQRAALAEAEAALEVAEARLAQIKAGAEPEQLAGAEAAVGVAQGRLEAAEGTLAAAQARLARLRAGATSEEIGVAERQVEAAKNALYSAQVKRDAICGQPGSGASCDAAKGTVQQAEEAVRIAELQLEEIKKGAVQEDLDAAEAVVRQAEGERDAARSGVLQAQAALAQLKKGSTEEAIAVAEAQVTQARAGVERARAALADTELRAPIAGRVARIDARLGEVLAPGLPAIYIADTSAWQVETDDLTEKQVVEVQVGQKVTIVPDALPDARIPGAVEAIDDAYQERRGDITYTVHVRIDQPDPRLRWGMTVKVEFE